MSTATELAQAREILAAWIEAEFKLTTGQEYTLGNRTLRRVNLPEIRTAQAHWRKRVALLEGTASAYVQRVVVHD